ncbi:sporozoite-associated mosquito saliva protein 1-like [Haematobia irritans]|uniref:sporozoite-associated mosquito saliva protein 1-like n=1 Tax=Haematobia irritans TaxID=7368 RepID=UPI003F5095F9
MYSKTLLNLIIIAIVVDVAIACNGYKVKILKSENCVSDPVIAADPEFTLKLNKKCELIPTGCIINKPFKTAAGKYKVAKDGIVVKEGKVDLCNVGKDLPDEVKGYLKMFGVPSSCPVEETKLCGDDKKIDINNFKALLGLARGTVVVDVTIDHDTGKSCMHIEAEVTK